ncbi:ABC transporter ATP-binding protein [Paraclostridium sordellii]|uniref:ABC transporter ATP-binding protein n=1 Tax=Paraclostridium sordellii TaxID=1505 RepID=UPI0005E04797|nr:ABC transporter ATP-binding protein [Paeniclostridium sordellii]MDU4413189.1 ABC transporter ATP-binding protein [Paeniclostridium sordellii]MDU6483621.1 ABC transporter ATP-binding protein [Paeniclostridium sordellii]MRZ30122.1 ATP-binding cassette domain-containing protein [Paeniclostridium sordellii]MVO76037.1 ATP-binding cassette domain-containing protein [Paeniclostridium sordellii]CEN83556.1 ABC transporter ATP-binding protein [[Clostridium] sordellii] [Paeniclostridium sordellii]
MQKHVLKTKNLSKEYKKIVALKNINISIKKGDIYGLIGENGAGKTTLIRLITGLIYQTNGEIELFEEMEASKLSKQRRRIGCIIESPVLYEDMTAKQNLEIIRVQMGIPGKGCIDEVLNLVNLPDTKSKKVKDFSLGMKQRLALAIALLGDPEFLILDEPINGLDPIGIIEFRELIKKLNREKKITILISSHILSELHQLATYYGIIHKGNLIEEISVEELNERCKKHINLEVDDSAKASIILENNLKIKNFSVLPNNVIKIYDYLDRVKLISNELVSNGVGIERINTQGDGLEEYFTRLIGGNRNV